MLHGVQLISKPNISQNGLIYLARLHASKILSAKAWLQGEKHSKVEYLASIFNAAGAFLSQNIAA